MSAVPSPVAAKRNFRSKGHWLLGAAWLCVTATLALIWHNDYQAASAAGYLSTPAWQTTLFYEGAATIGSGVLSLVMLLGDKRFSGGALIVGAILAVPAAGVMLYFVAFLGSDAFILLSIPILLAAFAVACFIVGRRVWNEAGLDANASARLGRQ
jgi:hypothetical protein